MSPPPPPPPPPVPAPREYGIPFCESETVRIGQLSSSPDIEFAEVGKLDVGLKVSELAFSPSKSPLKSPSQHNIIDIRRSKLELSLKDEILAGLKKPEGEKTLPTLLLYDAKGLKLFQDITYLDEYYLTNAEIELLNENARGIAERIPHGAAIIELGSGNLRKVSIILQALDQLGKKVSYYALDLSLPELERTLNEIPPYPYQHVTFNALHGTYDDGIAWLQSSPLVEDIPRVILWLGSSIGNFDREDAADFVKEVCGKTLRRDRGDLFIVGVDGCKDAERVWAAYNDREGVTREFLLNGLWNANGILGEEAFRKEDWEYEGRWNAELGCHEGFYRALNEVKIRSVVLKKDERIRVERSYKFDDDEMLGLFEKAGLKQGNVWKYDDHTLRMAYRPMFEFEYKNSYSPLPTLSEFETLWKAWDFVTLEMLPPELLHSKPIDLRNDCIFYLGHIPTFLDIQLTKSTGEPATVASKDYYRIFERGIDPDVDDPTQCHQHSEIPDSWPDLHDILDFRDLVRDRTRKIYRSFSHDELQNGSRKNVGRALWMAYEHEAMHLETFMYMLLQVPEGLPPPGVPVPDFAALNKAVKSSHTGNDDIWITIPATTITHGTAHDFSWDNEKPVRTSSAPSVQVKPQPITVGVYASYLETLPPPARAAAIPKTWTPDGAHIKTFWGPIPLSYVRNWPVHASYDQLCACAVYLGGRIPTRDELLSIYDYAAAELGAAGKRSDRNDVLDRVIPGVNSHLLANGVTETPPSLRQTFTFHPSPLPSRLTPAQTWEWTSTVLTSHEGFKPDELYPGYTADFFDGKHNVVLGGGWATVPRIRERNGFVNWYQRGYEFAWVGARVVRDVN